MIHVLWDHLHENENASGRGHAFLFLHTTSIILIGDRLLVMDRLGFDVLLDGLLRRSFAMSCL